MQQVLQAEIKVPDGMLVVPEDYIKQLIEQQREGVIWNMKEFAAHTTQSKDWIIEKILIPHQEELDSERGGFVKYPEGKGSPYKIGALQMTRWIEQNMPDILK